MGNVHPLNEGLLSSGHLPGCVGTGGYSGEPQSLDSALKRARLEHAYPWLPQQSESEHSVSFTSPLGSNSSLREETHTGYTMREGGKGKGRAHGPVRTSSSQRSPRLDHRPRLLTQAIDLLIQGSLETWIVM